MTSSWPHSVGKRWVCLTLVSQKTAWLPNGLNDQQAIAEWPECYRPKGCHISTLGEDPGEGGGAHDAKARLVMASPTSQDFIFVSHESCHPPMNCAGTVPDPRKTVGNASGNVRMSSIGGSRWRGPGGVTHCKENHRYRTLVS